MPSWSPDGKSIAFMGKRGRTPNDTTPGTCTSSKPAPAPAPRGHHQVRRHQVLGGRGRPDWSPDGSRRIVYTQTSGAKLNAYNMNRLAVVGAAGGEPRCRRENSPRARPRRQRTRSSADGKSILVPGARRPLGVPGHRPGERRRRRAPRPRAGVVQLGGAEARMAVWPCWRRATTRPPEIHAFEPASSAR